jgi:regulator of sigma E protease
MSLGLLILGLFLFVMLVVVHEFGHFIAARRSGVGIEEFGIFFPPRLWSKKTKKGWIFSINLLPLGGFVRLKGEHDADKRPGSFGAASLKNKVKIMLAGVGMNLLTAFVLLTILAWLGLPQLINNQYAVKSDVHTMENETLVASVENNSPAASAGLQRADVLISITSNNGKTTKITSANGLPAITKSFAGQRVQLKFTHNKQLETRSVVLRTNAVVIASDKTTNPEGYLGISPSQYSLQRFTWSAPVVAFGLIVQFTALTFHGLWTAISSLFTGNTTKAASQVTGPVGIFEILKSGTLLGYQFILMIIAVISLSLAIMNVLPIPALDGGKLFVTLISRAINKQISEKAENIIYGTGFAILFALIIVITIVDVKRN